MRRLQVIILSVTVLILSLTSEVIAQPGFIEHPLANGWNSWSAVLFDMDNDNDSDIVASSRLTSQLAWWENDGAVFTQHTLSGNATYAMGLVAGDPDQDGDADVICAVQETDKVEWWENDGSQTFTRKTVGSIVSPNQVCLADLDNDDDPDIVVSACEDGSDKIAWFENLGDKTFSIHIVKDNWDHANSVSTADMDYDGDMDILATASFRTAASGGEIAWFENLGDNQFSEHNVISDYYRPSNAVAADIDGDDDMDILATVCNINHLELFRNDGNLVFTKETIATGFIRPHCIKTADLNLDSIPDIVATAMDSKEISWWENDGNSFTKHIITSSFNGATWIDAGDIDLDGDPDILGTAQYANQIKWWENELITGLSWVKNDTDQTEVHVFPNPFSETLTIRAEIVRHADCRVTVNELSGRLIKLLTEGMVHPGIIELTWDGKDAAGAKLSSGNYLLNITTGKYTISGIVTLIN